MDILNLLMDDVYATMSLLMDKTSSEIFSEWLLDQLKERGISMSELARRGNISKQVISKYINDPPDKYDIEILTGIADGLGMPREHVLRKAGALKQVGEDRERIDELRYLAGLLDDVDLQEVIDYARHRLDKQNREAPKNTSSRINKHPARNG